MRKMLACLKNIRPCSGVFDRWAGRGLDEMRWYEMLTTMKACATRAACKGAANEQTDQTAIKINLLQGGSDQ